MKVIAKRQFRDIKTNEIVEPFTVLELTKARAKKLIKNDIVIDLEPYLLLTTETTETQENTTQEVEEVEENTTQEVEETQENQEVSEEEII